MALECHEPTQFSPQASLTNNYSTSIKEISSKRPHNSSSSSLLPKPINNNNNSSEEYSGRQLIITDLPPALVSDILHFLDAKDLGIVSCVSTFLHSLVSNHFAWKHFYFHRWGPPPHQSPISSWKDLFTDRELRTTCFTGRFTIDTLHGHTDPVRSVHILQSANLVFTAGYDSVVRMWHLDDGFAIAESKPLGCTVRAVSADKELLIAAGTGAFIQCWRAVEGNPHLFDINGGTSSEFRLRGHQGPVTCLALDSNYIFSGSWDMSVRIWDRASLKCSKILRHGDWVHALVPRGATVATAAGRDAYVWNIGSGSLVSVIQNAHVGNTHALARSYSGDLLFTGGDDGRIHMFEVVSCGGEDDDVRPRETWNPHTGPVNSLAFEFPWLVSSSSDGRLALINVRKLLRSKQRSRVNKLEPYTVEPPQRMLHGFGSNLFSVAIGVDRIVCGGEEGVVRVWNFSQALEIEKRVRALKSIRLENRMRRRKVQIDMNGKVGQLDQSRVSPKRNQMNGSRNGVWHGKQRDRKS